MTQLLQAQCPGEKEQDLLNVIQRSGEALLTIINDILDFSKIEAGQMELDPQPFNLKNSIEDVTALLGSKKSTGNVELLFRYQPDLPFGFIGDVGRIRQILMNILGNALKFTEVGHVLIDVSGEERNGFADLRFRIEDTGIGIPADKIKAIFHEFQQADGSTTRKYGGTGLGLSIAKSFIELMGGSLEVESDVGVGSKFSFSISLPIQSVADSRPEKQARLEPMNILVVDDNEVNRLILTEQLKHWGLHSIAVASVKKGLSVLKISRQNNVNIDLVLLAYQMPEFDGRYFLECLSRSKNFTNVPVIVLSSINSPSVAQEFKALGAREFLIKPTKLSLLYTAIRDIDHLVKEPVQMVESRATLPVPNFVSRKRMGTQKVDILVAEDSEVNQEYIEFVFADLRLSYEIVENGREAVEAWQALSPAIILMDISMPEMDGFEATKAIRKIENHYGVKRTPIIAVTAHAMSHDRQRCLKNDMDDYLSKPWSIQEMQEVLGKWNAA